MKRMLLAIGWMLLSAVASAQEVPWTAKWIQAPWSTVRDGAELDGSRPMPIFRREFTCAGQPIKAVLRIAGLGQWDLELDGKPAQPLGVHEAWTDYRKTVTYTTVDLSGSIAKGPHVIGVMLGNGNV